MSAFDKDRREDTYQRPKKPIRMKQRAPQIFELIWIDGRPSPEALQVCEQDEYRRDAKTPRAEANS